jgi:hypothetical protein
VQRRVEKPEHGIAKTDSETHHKCQQKMPQDRRPAQVRLLNPLPGLSNIPKVKNSNGVDLTHKPPNSLSSLSSRNKLNLRKRLWLLS